jgi:hypothetical protein
LSLQPAAAVAVSVTVEFSAKLPVHVEPEQFRPVGELVIEPLPVRVTVSACNGVPETRSKVTVAVRFCEIAMVQVVPLLPVQPPPQRLKTQPLAGVAVSLTWVFLAKLPVQVLPQLIPAGALVTVPLPVRVSFSVCISVETGSNVTVAVRLVETEMVQVSPTLPVQPLPQLLTRQPASGEAVRVTTVPLSKLAWQVLPQLIPAGELTTVPFPIGVTVKVGRVACANAVIDQNPATNNTVAIPRRRQDNMLMLNPVRVRHSPTRQRPQTAPSSTLHRRFWHCKQTGISALPGSIECKMRVQ